ncbi:helix-turn-helix domain-containing protein [Pseudoclavibacter alba]|uniref:Helix-turn-helix domain-containing protein n=1 Tax=Pseudoclavibacter albus TaxID=272241 RepID=A0ABT2HWF3_9MICO|nr:helix-turn-helix transcriptional regulator [Pseudoclavibacter alba]MCT2042647.1 helix-turn-helix domain-containing protein [Pseudoclavibacter alba]
MDIRKRGSTFAKYVGLQLKGEIITRGKTANEVAKATRHSPAAFNRWLNGKTELPLAVLCEVADYIGVDPQVIVDTAYNRLCVEFGERDGKTYSLEAQQDARQESKDLENLTEAANEPVAPPAPPISLDEHRNVLDVSDIADKLDNLPFAALEDETDPSMMLDNSETKHVDDEGFSTDNNEEGA